MIEFIKQCGFDSEQEFYQMMAKPDLSSPEVFKKFNNWKQNDGTKQLSSKFRLTICNQTKFTCSTIHTLSIYHFFSKSLSKNFPYIERSIRKTSDN